MNAPREALIASIRLYQAAIRPIANGACRFHPRCSDYAIEALRCHGLAGGSALAARRILRCNPWVAGGYDPVPPAAPPSAARRVKTGT